MTKEILIITSYFPPEKGAAANRVYSLAQGLDRVGFKVEIICPLPNYPTGKILKKYKSKIISREKESFGKINRLWVWPNNSSNKFLRLLSMLSFCFSMIMFFVFAKTSKKIFIQYSPIFIGFTATCLGRLFSKRIILNISDLWPSAGLEMGVLNKGVYYNILLKMEVFCYSHADLIVGQSQEILQHVKKFELKKPVFLYRNLPDFEITKIFKNNISSPEIKIVYAGLLGVAQGLYEICQRISLPDNISLHIYGNGPEAGKIKSIKKSNFYFYGELDRKELHVALKEYDAVLIPLIGRIYGSVPSKIFEYSSLGLPVLYFAGGEGETIVIEESLGWVIPVNDFNALQNFINSFTPTKLTEFSKKEVQQRAVLAFNFKQQFEKFVRAIATI